jgi:hypothetical protein
MNLMFIINIILCLIFLSFIILFLKTFLFQFFLNKKLKKK